MQMGCFFVHVYHRRHDIFFAYPVNEEVSRPLKKRLYLLGGLPLKNSGLAVISVSTTEYCPYGYGSLPVQYGSV